MSAWLGAWLAWGGAFVVIETLAVLRKEDAKATPDTLSQHVWWFRDHVKGGRVLLAGGLAFLSYHLLFG